MIGTDGGTRQEQGVGTQRGQGRMSGQSRGLSGKARKTCVGEQESVARKVG